jgi:dTDP-4-dehydrorhamnose reductase
MKIAVIGSNGQLGSEIMEALGKDATAFDIKDLDVTDYHSLDILAEKNPDIIINTAGYVKVSEAEDDSENCFKVNAIGAFNVARVCRKINAINVYIGTDYVFDGKKKFPYNESDFPNPLNVYGASKYAGEIFTRNYSERYYILRLSSLFGRGAKGKSANFIEKIIEKARKGETIEVVNDIVMSPTYARDVASNLKRFFKLKPAYGIYHFANKGYCSWHEFATKILETMKIEADVKKAKSHDQDSRITRPAFTALENPKLKKLGIEMRSWDKALEDCLKNYYSKR